MKKNLVAMALSLALAGVLCFGLAACGGDTSVTSVTLDEHTLRLEVGDTATLTATVEPEKAKDKSISWLSYDESVATVSNGTVTAVSAGSATIEVKTTDGEHTDHCSVYVTKPAKDMGDYEWQTACFETVGAQQYHLTALQRGTYNNSIFTTFEIDNQYDGAHNTLYSYRKIAGDNFDPSSPTYDETKLYVVHDGETTVMYQHSGVRWAKINAPSGDSYDYNDILNEYRDLRQLEYIRVGENEDSWALGSIAYAFSLFTYNESKEVFEAHLYIDDNMSFEGYADVTVAIKKGRITEMTISGEGEDGVVYDTVYTVTYDEELSIPEEVITEATKPIAPGALTQEEWEAAFAKTTASSANFTMTYSEAPGATPVVVKVAADKKMVYVSDTGDGSEGYMITKDGITGSFTYEDGTWSEGKYIFPKAFESSIANYEYCGNFMDYGFSYIMSLGSMLYGYVTYNNGVYTLDLSSFGASGMIPVDFEFNADKTLKSVKLEGIVDGEGMLMSVTFSDYGSTAVTPPEGYVMPEAPSLTKTEWEEIFADMADAKTANFTVRTQSYDGYYTVQVDAARGMIAVLGEEYECYYILDESGTSGGEFTYYKESESWGNSIIMTPEEFARFIENFDYPNVNLYFLSGLKQIFDYAVGYNNGTYRFEHDGSNYSATIRDGKLANAYYGRYGYSAEFSKYGTTQIQVPAGRPAMPQAMEKSAFDSAMEATKAAKVYNLDYYDDENTYSLYYDGENYEALIYVYNYSASAGTYYLIRVEGNKVVTYTKIEEVVGEKTEQTCASAAAAQEAWLAAIKDKITVLADVLADEFAVEVDGQDETVTVDSMYSAIEWKNETCGDFRFVLGPSSTQYESIYFSDGKLSRIFRYSFSYNEVSVRMNIEWIKYDFGLIDYD